MTMVTSMFAGCGKEAASTDVSVDNSVNNQTETTSDSGEKANTLVEVKYTASLPTGPEEASIYIEAVPGMSDDFIKGVDISTIIVQEESGVRYKNIDGVEEDIFKILADAGVNYIRVRVWNDPYDENGNGYGGGNCDYRKAAAIGRRAAEYGMKLLVDFHYSDFWADPSKQMAPKAWAGMTYLEKAEACYSYTLEAMNYILDAGAVVGMVQIGNETNNGMCGETLWSSICEIMKKGREAVLEAGAAYNQDIKIAVHFTNPENKSGIESIVRKLQTYGLEYDVFALSYYPYWHGSLDNLTKVMESIHKISGKEVMVVETSYAYTLEDGDGNGNSVSAKDLTANYAATVQSQALSVRDIAAAVASVGDYGLGVFYWEPAWTPVGVWEEGSDNADAVLAANKKIWEQTGSGWASSYAGQYDPNDAGVYYGGSAWDNQAMFDHNSVALPSLYVFRYLQYGTVCDLKLDFYNDVVVEMVPGEELVLPERVDVVYNDRSKNGSAEVTWNAEDIAAIDTGRPGRHTVRGRFADGSEVNCLVKIAAVNQIENGSFEDISRTSMLTITEAASGTVDFQQKEQDATTGQWSLHYWNGGTVDFKAEYTLTDVEPGTYCFNLYAQGGDSGNNPTMYIYVIADGKEYRQDYLVDGWINWKHPEISNIVVSGGDVTVGVCVKAAGGAWGTFDDFYFGRID